MNPEDVNKILSKILNRYETFKMGLSPAEMHEYGYSKEYLEAIFKFIINEKPNFITLKKYPEYSDEEWAYVVTGSISEIRIFLEKGGFSKQIDSKEKLEFTKLKREVYWWKDAKFWIGFIAGGISILLTVLGIYISWIKK